jgi:hypothetical protein
MRRAGGIVSVLLLTLLAACEGAPGQEGPLVLGGDKGKICLARGESTRFTVGIDSVTNRSTDPVSITDVSLVDARDMELIEAVIAPMPTVPNKNGSLILVGNWDSYPPPSSVSPEWHEREPAVGSSLPGGAARAFVFGVTADSDASATAVRVDYQTSTGKRYEVRTSTEVQLKERCS